MIDMSAEVQLTSLSPDFPGVQLTLKVQNPVQLFLTDVFFCLSENDETLSNRWPSNATPLLCSLRNLLPNKDFQAGRYHQDLITKDDMFQTKFNQILLFSIANGFAGLQGIPIQIVLKHLSRYSGINSPLLRFLQASQTHVAKALGENLFRAAIEEKNEPVLKRLLAVCSIDVNATTSIVCGEKFTPIERAAKLQDLGIVKLLVSVGADVNKTFAPISSDGGGPLARLISGIEWGTTVTPEAVQVSKVLLQAGAKIVPLQIAKLPVRSCHCAELFAALVFSVSETNHSELISHGFLGLIAEQLDDWEATEAINKIILACGRTNCGRCLTQFEDEVDWALVQGAKRGHLQLVRLLLEHSRAPHKALSAAIRFRRSKVIDSVLASGADLNALPHNIDTRPLDSKGYFREKKILTTSLAEAIKAKDESSIFKMEAAVSLEHLVEGRLFQAAIDAASKTGNIAYVRKLLGCRVCPEPSQMSHAVLYAVENDYEDIFWELLASGADVNMYSNESPAPPNPLFAAMLRRNHSMVRGILNANVQCRLAHQCYDGGIRRETLTIFGEAVKWGDQSIMEDLRSVFPNVILSGRELSEVLKNDNIAWFDFLLRSGIASQSALTNCLEVGLSKGDAILVHNLIERGADPKDRGLLKSCVKKHPKMLPILLKHISSPMSHQLVRGFGTEALKAAIRCGHAGIETVKVLLDSGLVDPKRFLDFGHVWPEMGWHDLLSSSCESPLGVAIRITRDANHADFAVIRKLLDAGCDPNGIVTTPTAQKPGFNQTALLEAIETMSKELVQLLISHGANISAEATLGLNRTPLQKAVEVDSLEIVTLLLELGADVNAKPSTRGGATALQLAAIGGNCNTAAKVLEYGAELRAPPAQVFGRWPLEGAAEHGRLDMIEFLWKVNRSSFPQEQCRKAMELAEENGHMACRDLIAELSLTGISSLPELRLGQWPSFETGLDLM